MLSGDFENHVLILFMENPSGSRAKTLLRLGRKPRTSVAQRRKLPCQASFYVNNFSCCLGQSQPGSRRAIAPKGGRMNTPLKCAVALAALCIGASSAFADPTTTKGEPKKAAAPATVDLGTTPINRMSA